MIANSAASPAHDPLMDRCGWPAIQYDGSLLVSHQDVLLMGGKVQAPAGYADHVVFRDLEVCRSCGNKLCVEMCSGQAITRSRKACPASTARSASFAAPVMWNCPETVDGQTNCSSTPASADCTRPRIDQNFARNLDEDEHSFSNCGLRQCRARSVADPGTRDRGPTGPSLKNEMMLPAILDPWAAHALV